MSAETTQPENETTETSSPDGLETPAAAAPPVAGGVEATATADDGAPAGMVELAPEPPAFDIESVKSFAELEAGRSKVHSSLPARRAFERKIQSLGTSGDEGRRRGLSLWILGDFAGCAEALASHESDDTAAYTRARALFALHRYDESVKIFERLAGKYPDEPAPRAGLLEARVEAALAAGADDHGSLADELEKGVQDAPALAGKVEAAFLRGRACELRRDWEEALDHYAEGHDIDSDHMRLTRRFAHLAERCGLDELAIQLYEHLVTEYQADKSVFMNLGVLYEDHGRDSDAASCYDTVHENDGTDERARLYLTDARAAIDSYYDEDLEKKEDRLNQILRIPITDFELSVRARNCLNKMQINTLGDLVQKTEQELLSYKNFGETSLTEIKEILHSKGLRLGMPREEAVASIEAHANRSTTGDRQDVMNKPVLDLQLSIRARRTVETLGCLTVGDITKHSAAELLGMPNFGQTSLQELRSKLAELGLKLKGD